MEQYLQNSMCQRVSIYNSRPSFGWGDRLMHSTPTPFAPFWLPTSTLNTRKLKPYFPGSLEATVLNITEVPSSNLIQESLGKWRCVKWQLYRGTGYSGASVAKVLLSQGFSAFFLFIVAPPRRLFRYFFSNYPHPWNFNATDILYICLCTI